METINRGQLEIDLEDSLYEIFVGGHVCLIGKAGYIDWLIGGGCLCDDNKVNK